MNKWIQAWVNPGGSTNQVQANRLLLVHSINAIFITIGLLYLVWVTITVAGQPVDPMLGGPTRTAVVVIPATLVLAASSWLARKGRIEIASFLTGLIVTLALIGISASNGIDSLPDGIGIGAAMIIFALLNGRVGTVAGLVIGIAETTYSFSNMTPTVEMSSSRILIQYVASILLMLAIAGATYAFWRFAVLSRAEGAANAEVERLKLATLTSQIAQRISRRNALNVVLEETVEQIRTQYPTVYHAQIFLMDAMGVDAKLAASTGEVGKRLLERKHSLPVGSQSVIGRVTGNNVPVIARAGSAEHKRNELLPETEVEAAFPLRLGDTVIGALDMQSRLSESFNEADIPIFQSLADHIAIAIDNAQLFEESEKQLQANRDLVQQTQESAAQVEQLNRRLTGRGWSEYTAQRGTDGVNVSFNGTTSAQTAKEWTATLRLALQNNEAVQVEEDGSKTLAVPLRVRGEVIGAMEFELDANGQVSAEDLAMLEQVSEQLGLAAESNRLFETSQRLAQREALVNEIAGQLQATNNVETTLTTAARSLKDVLRANKVAIKLGVPTAQPTTPEVK
jgi:GAF domain-containing protein